MDKKKKTSTEIMFLTLVEVLAAYYCSNERAILFDADSTSIRSSSEIDWKRTSGKGYKVGRWWSASELHWYGYLLMVQCLLMMFVRMLSDPCCNNDGVKLKCNRVYWFGNGQIPSSDLPTDAFKQNLSCVGLAEK